MLDLILKLSVLIWGYGMLWFAIEFAKKPLRYGFVLYVLMVVWLVCPKPI